MQAFVCQEPPKRVAVLVGKNPNKCLMGLNKMILLQNCGGRGLSASSIKKISLLGTGTMD